MKHRPHFSRILNDKRRREVHPRDVVFHEMTERGWGAKDLASRMDGDALVNRVLIRVYLDHPTGDVGLGPAIAHRLGHALGCGAEVLLDLERQYRARAAATA